MIRLATTSAAVFLLGACGGADKGAESPATEQPCGGDTNPCGDMNPCGESQACASPMGEGQAPATDHDWAAWESWEKVSPEAFRSEGHEAAWVEVYVTPEHAEDFEALEGEMPQGMGIVKAGYADDGGAPGDLQNLTVMAKMEPGYDPDHGDWYYGVLGGKGQNAMQQGKLEMCIGCHEGAETDYVFGETGN